MAAAPPAGLAAGDVVAALTTWALTATSSPRLGGVHAPVQDMLVRSGLADEIGRAHLYRQVADASA